MDSAVLPHHSRVHPHPWRLFTATSVGVIAVFVSMSGLTVALPTLSRDLGASAAQSTWILVGYMVVTTALILVFGRLSDIIGRRPLYIGGLMVFTAATAFCAVCPSAELLIAARLLQGVGAAAIVTNNTSLLTDAFPARSLGRALGWNATVAAVAQIIGPVIGGATTALMGWRGLFMAVFVLAAVATVTSLWVIPRTPRSIGRREPFDIVGATLSTALLTVTVLALTPGLMPSTWQYWGCGGLAVVIATIFVTVQVRRAHPLVDVSLFRNRGIGLILVAALINAVATYAVALIISLFGQAVTGASPFTAGLLVTPVAVGTVVAASTAGILVARRTPRTLSAIGMALNVIGLLGVTLTLSVDDHRLLATSVFLFVTGCGIGLFMTPSTSALMLAVPTERRGIANGMRSTLQNVGNLFSTALVLAIVPTTVSAASPHSELSPFVDDLRIAGFALTGIAALGIAVCLAFPRQRPVLSPFEIPTESLTKMKESA
ncbi:MFS transporter [Gordonia sp. CPCC 206044]|uniref:MFS transporter n=1 Tax=Gordonia sp. CPCC 206044 TaxID=3140793 RepID=UPI003AF33C2B